MKHDRAARYQYQNWLVRRWRDRWLLCVPWWTLRTWLHQFKSERPLPLRHCYSIERGMADVRRNYLWDWAEVRMELGKARRAKGK